VSTTEFPCADACTASHNRSDATSVDCAVADTAQPRTQTRAHTQTRAPARARTSSARRLSPPRRAGTCRRALGVLAGYSRGDSQGSRGVLARYSRRGLIGYPRRNSTHGYSRGDSGTYSRGDTRGTHMVRTWYSQGTRRGHTVTHRVLTGCSQGRPETAGGALHTTGRHSAAQWRRRRSIRGELYIYIYIYIYRRTRRS
jgi:hypothetical protein